MSIKDKYKVVQITNKETNDWLLNVHYAHRKPSISFAFALILNDIIVGVCTFGSPPSRPLCIGLCGKEHSHLVLELNRLVKRGDLERNVTSYFVSQCMKLLPQPRIVVSYADTSQNHNGYVYQACNFLYTGLSAKRTEWRMHGNNLHSKSICDRYSLEERKSDPRFYLAKRPQKHRYVLFLGNKRDKKFLTNKLKYGILGYPKGKSVNYEINEYPENHVKENL